MKTFFNTTPKSQAGYTLVELIIYFALVSLLFIQLTSLFLTVLDAKKDIHALSGVERDGQYMYARLVYDINRAEQIVEPGSLGASSDTLRLLIDGVEHRYQVVNTRLTLTINGQGIPLHADTLASEFLTTRLGNVGGKHTLQLRFRVTSPIQENRGQESQLFQTSVGER